MKAMIISDIHGGTKYLQQVIDRYKEEKADRLIILGDFSRIF